jgi:hypothetical protein
MKVCFKYCTCLIAFLFCVYTISAQSEKWQYVGRTDMAKIFEQMNNWFKNTPTYSLTIAHASFEDHQTIVPFERSVGYFKKDKNNYHSYLLGIHTIQNSTFKIVIDTAEKIMMAATPDQLVWNSYTLDDYTYLLKNCLTIKVTDIGTDKKYKMEFEEGSNISRYEFLFSSEGLLKEVVSYYNEKMKKGDDENSPEVSPRISITFSEYKKNPVLNYREEFDESKYFTQKNNKLIAADPYKDFKFSDQRVNLN